LTFRSTARSAMTSRVLVEARGVL